MSEHERTAEELERELDDMERQSDRLEGEIGDTRDDWERKKRDDKVPGAAGQPEQAEQDLPPEADYTSKRD
jgi:phage shock protein A